MNDKFAAIANNPNLSQWDKLQLIDHLTESEKELIKAQTEAEQDLLATYALWSDFAYRWSQKFDGSSGAK